jgi:hypothetical protein
MTNNLLTQTEFVAAVVAFNGGDFLAVLSDATELELSILADQISQNE